MRLSRTMSHAIGGMYSWIVTIYLGAVLLDMVYSRLLRELVRADVQTVYSEVSDLLLLFTGLTLLAGVLAVGFAWNNTRARNLFAASLGAILLAWFLAFALLIPLSRTTPESGILSLGPLIRLVPLGLASVISLLGFRSLSRSSVDRPVLR